jgi:hypothetical protein
MWNQQPYGYNQGSFAYHQQHLQQPYGYNQGSFGYNQYPYGAARGGGELLDPSYYGPYQHVSPVRGIKNKKKIVVNQSPVSAKKRTMKYGAAMPQNILTNHKPMYNEHMLDTPKWQEPGNVKMITPVTRLSLDEKDEQRVNDYKKSR